ncbi:FxSxx-COOH system tetratricopeptide repeat protein [Micromonospora sp. NPDC127501]|uniref:FxSxx-COOH system tetratricopeptide repeat protein n=1 Tax=Micromonospora sp. NPDC127501 TaxID=3154872 RepID=UPI00332CAC02
MTTPRMPSAQVQAICDALLSMSSINDGNTRSLYLDEVEGELRKRLSVPRHSEVRYDVYRIVRACAQEPRGMSTLLQVIANFHPGASAVTSAQQIYLSWLLAQLLTDVPPDVLAGAVAAVADHPLSPEDLPGLVDAVGWQPVGDWQVPAAVALAGLVHAGLESDGKPLEQWLRDAAAALRLTTADLDDVRVAAKAHWTSLRSPHQAAPAEAGGEEPESDMRRTIIIEETTPQRSRTLIRGGVPPRNLYFTGREKQLVALDELLSSQHRASVLPEAALRGVGGVGKTQLAVEFAYRYADRYQLIWWMAAEDLSALRTSIAALGERLGLAASASLEQTVRTVLDSLSTSSLSWLLVYDNADDPHELAPLMPSSNLVGERGHVLVTSRNMAWSASALTLDVDVFTRAESVELLLKRRPATSPDDARRLAAELGDLPLALEQAVSWLLTMLSSVDEYLVDLKEHARELLGEGQPRQYRGTVLTVVSMALAAVREQNPAAAQLIQLLAFLSPDPVPMRLLWEGRRAGLDEPLRTSLQERNDIARAIRQLASLGLAKADNASRQVQVHRLVQAVIREGLAEQGDDSPLTNARRLLAAANPGFPDDRSTWPRHADIAPHVRVAGLIHGDLDARRTAMDQLRYIYNLGDFEGCRDFAEEILAAWDQPGPDGERSGDPLTLLAMRRYADALRLLADPRAAVFGLEALERMRTSLGEEHEYTLGAANSVGADLRRIGDFAAAADLDRRNLDVHRRVLGDGHPSTLRVMNSMAINLRLTGDFEGAYELNLEVARHAGAAAEDGTYALVLAQEAQARDLYLLGRYADALELLDSSLPVQRSLLGAEHLTVLRATCIHIACLRKTGRLDAAVTEGAANYRLVTRRFGTDHVLAAEAGMTCANAMRAAGDATQAYALAAQGHATFRAVFGERHPVTLCAAVNLGVILRARNFDREARELGAATLQAMGEALPPTHPYLLSARTAQAINLVRSHRLEQAQVLSEAILEDSRRLRGPGHPYTLYCAVNASVDLIEVGEEDRGRELLDEAAAALEALFGPDHPEVDAARGQRRIECDIETVGLT